MYYYVTANKRKHKQMNKLEEKKKREIMESEIFQAASIAFQNGCCHGYDLHEMAHYMFVEGVKYAKTNKVPKLLDGLL